MKLIKRIKLNKIENFLKKLPRNLGENSFSTLLGFILLSLILGTFVFYQYSILAERKTPEVIEKPLQFKEKTYQTILNEWQKRTERFSGADLKEYPDPFK